MNALFSRIRCGTFQITIPLAIFIFFVCTTSADPQTRGALTANEIIELLKSGLSTNRLVQLVELHGVTFELDDQTSRRLKENGATSEVLSSVRKMSARVAEEKQRMRQEEEVAKRLREEGAKRREKAKLQAEQEQRRLAELERKKAEEAKQRAEEVRQREQVEARRREEEKRRADEQKRQQDEAEMARLAEERRRHETRLSEEKRQAEQAARVAEAERKKSEELVAKNKIEEEKSRIQAKFSMDQMKNGFVSSPTYSEGDVWYFSGIEDFDSYDSRALQGVYELRYSGEQFQIFKDKQRVSAKEAFTGALLAMVGRGRYMGGQYLKFPLNTGQKWSQQYEAEARGSRTILSWTSETTVTGVENITTQAGKFAVFKVVREARSHTRSKATFTYYYSPEAKSIVKMLWEFSSGSRTIELMKFKFGQEK